MAGSIRFLLFFKKEALAFLLALLCHTASAQPRFPAAEWSHIAPAADGWSDSGLAEAHTWADTLHSTAVMVIHHGAVVCEWGDTEKRTELASVRKSLLNSLIGIAVANHQINLDTTVGALGLDDNPPSLSEEEKTATVRMLLQARSGIYHPALYETAAMSARRPARASHKPGTFWYYNNWDFNALGAIYEQATHTSIFDALDEQIAKPIGMQDYRPQDGVHYRGAASNIPAYPIRMSARDLARFALLWLNNGAWNGTQIIPADWVRDSTTIWSHTNAGEGYGYLWWLPRPGHLPPRSFFAWGAGGQFAFIIPENDLVIVSRVDRDQHLPEPKLGPVLTLMEKIIAAGPFSPR